MSSNVSFLSFTKKKNLQNNLKRQICGKLKVILIYQKAKYRENPEMKLVYNVDNKIYKLK